MLLFLLLHHYLQAVQPKVVSRLDFVDFVEEGKIQVVVASLRERELNQQSVF